MRRLRVISMTRGMRPPRDGQIVGQKRKRSSLVADCATDVEERGVTGVLDVWLVLDGEGSARGVLRHPTGRPAVRLLVQCQHLASRGPVEEDAGDSRSDLTTLSRWRRWYCIMVPTLEH